MWIVWCVFVYALTGHSPKKYRRHLLLATSFESYQNGQGRSFLQIDIVFGFAYISMPSVGVGSMFCFVSLRFTYIPNFHCLHCGMSMNSMGCFMLSKDSSIGSTNDSPWSSLYSWSLMVSMVSKFSSSSLVSTQMCGNEKSSVSIIYSEYPSGLQPRWLLTFSALLVCIRRAMTVVVDILAVRDRKSKCSCGLILIVLVKAEKPRDVVTCCARIAIRRKMNGLAFILIEVVFIMLWFVRLTIFLMLWK